jgi:23S rRNA pseudouridine2605 synthase
MRINKYVAQATGLSRRAADQAISEGRVSLNAQPAALGDIVASSDIVALDNRPITPVVKPVTIMLNKPVGYVCSRQGQGSLTIYDLLPTEYQRLKPVGRLDKDSTGLLLLTNDGDLAQQLTHPSFAKTKIYQVQIDKPLEPLHHQMISDIGVRLEDGPSKFNLEKLSTPKKWQVTMQEGRNRQIRRTFAALGYTVTKLNRSTFGPYDLGYLETGKIAIV